jgi:hypothetical protein
MARGITCRGPDGLTHQLGRGREVGPYRIGAGVAREIDPDQRGVLGQRVAAGTPQAGGLGEAVQEHQGRARPAYFDMERHVR